MSTIKQRIAVAVSAGAISLAGVAGIANAASGPSGATGASGADPARNSNETMLTGATLKSASDAAIAANRGATVNRASTEDPADANGAAYEVKITKADGTRAEVLEDSAFMVLSTKADTGRGRGHGGPGGRGGRGNPNETTLTGTDLTQAKRAAESAVSGGTAERATTEDPAENTGAAYEVHVKKADGSRVTVLLDKSFGVVKTVADSHRPRGN